MDDTARRWQRWSRTVREFEGNRERLPTLLKGRVWTAILVQTDLAVSTGDFISTEDTPRKTLSKHPWNMGGGGAAEVQAAIEGKWSILKNIASEIGICSVTGEDDAYTFGKKGDAVRLGLHRLILLVVGDAVRDFSITKFTWAVWPHGSEFEVIPLNSMPDLAAYLWPMRSILSKRKRFGTPMIERSLTWYEFQEIYPNKFKSKLTITLAEVATYNHFVLDRGGKVFKQTAPVIKLTTGATGG